MLGAGDRQGRLAAGLGQLATTYRRQADRQAEAFRIILPGLLMVGIGATAVLGYGLLLFVPLRHLWDGLASPLNDRPTTGDLRAMIPFPLQATDAAGRTCAGTVRPSTAPGPRTNCRAGPDGRRPGRRPRPGAGARSRTAT